MKESTVIRLSIFQINILEEFRQTRIGNLSRSLKQEQNEIAKSCYLNDIERFKNMKSSELLTEYMSTMEFFKKGLINL